MLKKGIGATIMGISLFVGRLVTPFAETAFACRVRRSDNVALSIFGGSHVLANPTSSQFWGNDLDPGVLTMRRSALPEWQPVRLQNAAGQRTLKQVPEGTSCRGRARSCDPGGRLQADRRRVPRLQCAAVAAQLQRLAPAPFQGRGEGGGED